MITTLVSRERGAYGRGGREESLPYEGEVSNDYRGQQSQYGSGSAQPRRRMKHSRKSKASYDSAAYESDGYGNKSSSSTPSPAAVDELLDLSKEVNNSMVIDKAKNGAASDKRNGTASL